MEQLKDIGCKWVILGHSERRHVIGEDDQVSDSNVYFLFFTHFQGGFLQKTTGVHSDL